MVLLNYCFAGLMFGEWQNQIVKKLGKWIDSGLRIIIIIMNDLLNSPPQNISTKRYFQIVETTLITYTVEILLK